jgi:hypothetical protein
MIALPCRTVCVPCARSPVGYCRIPAQTRWWSISAAMIVGRCGRIKKGDPTCPQSLSHQ